MPAGRRVSLCETTRTGRPAARGAPGLPSGRPGRGDQKEENLRLFLLLDFLFSLMGRVWIGSFTCQSEKRSAVLTGIVQATLKTISHMNFAAVGAVFFVSVTGYVTRGSGTGIRSARWTRGLMNCGGGSVRMCGDEFRRKFINAHSFLLPSPSGKVSPPQAVTDEALTGSVL